MDWSLYKIIGVGFVSSRWSSSCTIIWSHAMLCILISCSEIFFLKFSLTLFFSGHSKFDGRWEHFQVNGEGRGNMGPVFPRSIRPLWALSDVCSSAVQVMWCGVMCSVMWCDVKWHKRTCCDEIRYGVMWWDTATHPLTLIYHVSSCHYLPVCYYSDCHDASSFFIFILESHYGLQTPNTLTHYITFTAPYTAPLYYTASLYFYSILLIFLLTTTLYTVFSFSYDYARDMLASTSSVRAVMQFIGLDDTG